MNWNTSCSSMEVGISSLGLAAFINSRIAASYEQQQYLAALLPSDIIVNIAKYLNVDDTLTFSLVCSKFKRSLSKHKCTLFKLWIKNSIDFNLIIAFAQLGGFDINDILDSGSLTAINNNENSNGTSGTVVPSSTILWWQTMRPTAHRNSRSLYKKSAAVAAAQLNLSGNTTKNYTYTYSSSADDEWKNLFYELKKLQTWLDNSHPVLECYIEVCKASSSSSPLTTRKFQSRDDADPVATILAETRVRSNTITEFHQHTTHHIHRLLSGSSIDDSNTQRVLQTLSLENGQRNFGSSGKTVRLMRLGHGIMGTGYNFDAEDGVGSPPLKYRRLKIQAIRLALLMWSVTVLTSKHLPRRSSWVGDWSNSSSTYDSPTSIPSSPRSPHAMISPRGSIGGRGGASSPFGGSGIGISQGNIIGGVGVGGGGGAGSASSSASTAVGAASNPLAAAVATTPTAPIAGHPAANMSNYQNHLAAQFEILRQLDTSTLGSLVLLLEATHQLLRQRFIKEGMDGREAMFHAFQTVSMGPGVVGLVLNPDVGGGGSVKAFNGSSNIYHQNYSFSNNTAVTSHNGVGNGGGVAPLLRNNLVVSNESLMRRGSESRIRSTSTTSRNNSNNNNNSYGRIHGSSIFVRDLIRNNPSLRPNAGPFLINTVFGVLAERGIFSMKSMLGGGGSQHPHFLPHPGSVLEPLSEEVDINGSPTLAYCGCKTPHQGRRLIDQLLPGLRKDQVFELIFRNGGSDILLEVHRRRGTDDLEIGDWEQLVQPPQQQELADQRQQQQLPPLVLFTRKLSYKYSFNGGILGSMSTVCSEQQTIMYQDSSRFVVESVSKTPFVPHGANFHLVHRYCLYETGPESRESRLQLHTDVQFIRKTMFKDVIEQLSIMGIEYFVQDLLGLLLQHCSNNGAEELNKSSLRSHLETIIRRKPNGPRSISQGISYNIVGSIAASTASSTNHNADHSPSSSVSSWEGPRAFSSRLDANINNHNSNTLQVVDSCSQPNQRNTIVQTSPQPQYQFPFSNIETGAESASSTLAPDHYNPHNNINTPSNASCSRPLRHRRRPLPQPLNTNIRFTSTPEPISSPRPDNNIFDNLRRQYQQLQLHDERQAAQQQKTDGGEQQLLHAGLVEENVNDLVNAQGKRRIKILRMPGRWIPHRRDPHKYLSHKGRQIWALKFEGIVGTFFLFTQVMSLICRIFRTNPLAILSATILAIKLVTKALYELMHSPE